MHQIANFSFEGHLVRVVTQDDEMWFAGKDVCACLGIQKHHQALDNLDDDERGACTVGTPRGEQEMIIISEPGVYRLVFRSRKPEAERFKRWLAHDVLPQVRRTGRYGGPNPGPDPPVHGNDPARWPVHLRLQAVQISMRLHGRDRASALWPKLGLPPVPPPPPTAVDEAWLCLRHLLDAKIYDERPRVRECLDAALEDLEDEQLLLKSIGVRAVPDREAFAIANRHPGLERIFAGTQWAGGLVAMRVLRRLPGAAASGHMRWGSFTRRVTMLPASLLDEMADEKTLLIS